MKTLQSITLYLLLSVLSACGISGKAIEGQVLEQGTGQPIGGAIVVTRWRGDLFAFVTTQSVCVHVETATTDARGRYRLPAWRKHSDIGWVRNVFPVITVYKQGYRQPEDYRNSVQHLESFRGTREERLGYLMQVLETTRCGAQDESERSLHPLYNALYREGLNLAESDKDKELVDTLRYWDSFVLLDPSKPTGRDEKGRLINVPGRPTK